MNGNSKIEHKLGFSQIRNSLKEVCLGEGGRQEVDTMEFMTDFHIINHNLDLANEFLSIFMEARCFPSDDYYDMRQELKRLKLEGTFIDRASLFDLKRSLHTIVAVIAFFNNNNERYPNLTALSVGLEIDKQILNQSDRLLDSEGEFFDTASAELQRIRAARKHKIAEIDRRIRRILGVSKQEGWTNDGAEITIRNGRQVIPVSSANKRRLKGFIHDYSASRNTSYIEPAEVVELGNEVRELHFQEEREIIRILTKFSELLRPSLNTLIEAYDFLSRIDFIRAKAVYAMKIRAGRPILENKPQIYWFDARHPLLEASLKANGKAIVPLKKIELNYKHRILIISGPNAGGKSVCLKTTGLLQYMLQCGLLVPVRETSEAGVFSRIFIDIGDEQSLEDDLSTYSSHLLNMKSLLEQADSRTLFLIDECGSGTDPQVGGAIAEAIIEDLNARKAFGVITTHYSNLKLLSDNPHNQGSIVNGAMLFDQKDMKPLYVLSIGKPGSSFAFEIARSTGLPDRIIHNALAKTGEGIMNFEQQLQQLEVEKENLKRREEQFQMADTLLAETIAKYERMIADFSSRKTEILLKAKQEAEQIMEGANRRIENVIAEIKTHNAEREITNSARNELNREISNLKTDLKRTKDNINSDKTHSRRSKRQIKESTPQFRFDNTPIAENDFVYLVGNNSVAQVLRLKKNRIEVSCGNLTMTLPIEEVQKIDKTSYLANEKKKRQTGKSITPSVNRSLMADINKKRAEFKYQIDLRGQKAEQALIIVAKQIDDARLLGEREFAVLHGTGDGILKVVIRDFLKTSSEVASFRPAVLENGGEGITIVKLN